eukprot:CAMPEP_0206494556 /NCGR_PEP_ID=MMETSP0324_2-20121206/47804_1 /ASSEMBLY_ACC=CAM_ASM_000836 /TAXON_ID=2866 /ORGANISM="Crypthecodinium cohnii, Strain Seligo" /LENGTH=58 /DNA_ID=CAMNT_0053978245 /DNA_START=150 /DNA_END=326 /DNA_ORIENTATION=+
MTEADAAGTEQAASEQQGNQEAAPAIAPKKQIVRKHTGYMNNKKAEELQDKKGCCTIS